MRKHSYTLATVLAIVLAACQPKENATVTSVPETLTFETMTDSAEQTINGTKCRTSISVAFPKNGNQPLLNILREWIADATGCADTVDIADGHHLMRGYSQTMMNELKDMIPDGETGMPQMVFEADTRVWKAFEDSLFVTLVVNQSAFTGGAHGFSYEQGATFRKSDGRQMGWNMLRNRYNENVQRLVTEGLMGYFHVSSTEQLKELATTFDDVSDFVRLPQNDPYLVKDSLRFQYQQYEVAPYAAGMPYAMVALKDLEEQLMPSFRRVLNTAPKTIPTALQVPENR